MLKFEHIFCGADHWRTKENDKEDSARTNEPDDKFNLLSQCLPDILALRAVNPRDGL